MQEPRSSSQSCLIYYLPHCLPRLHTRKGRWEQEKCLMNPWILPVLMCIASAFPVAEADLNLIFPFQKASFGIYYINTTLLFYSRWATKEMQRCSGTVPLPVLGLPDASLMPAAAEDRGFLWTCDGELYYMHGMALSSVWGRLQGYSICSPGISYILCYNFKRLRN